MFGLVDKKAKDLFDPKDRFLLFYDKAKAFLQYVRGREHWIFFSIVPNNLLGTSN